MSSQDVAAGTRQVAGTRLEAEGKWVRRVDDGTRRRKAGAAGRGGVGTGLVRRLCAWARQETEREKKEKERKRGKDTMYEAMQGL
jgi:two-component sensor histidine kinase